MTRRPKEWRNVITGTCKGSAWEGRGTITGKINIVSDNAKLISAGTKIFIVCAPSNVHEALVRKVAPYIEKGAYIGALYT